MKLFFKLLHSILFCLNYRQISAVIVAPQNRDAPHLGKRQFQWTARFCHLRFHLLHRHCQNSAPTFHCHLHPRHPCYRMSIIVHSHKWNLLGRLPCKCRRLCEHQRQNHLATVLNCYLNKRFQRPKRKWRPSIGTKYQITRYNNVFFFFSLFRIKMQYLPLSWMLFYCRWLGNETYGQ